MVVASTGPQNMEPDLQGKDAALRSQIREARSRLEQLLSSEERVLSVFKLRELNEELASLREVRKKHPCRYGLVQFTQDGRAIVTLPKSATAADFLHAFAHTIVRTLPADTLGICKQYLNSASSDVEADFEELFACALERFYWDDTPGDRSLDREPVRKALRKVYPTLIGTRIDLNLSPKLRDLFDAGVAKPPDYSGVTAAGPSAKVTETSALPSQDSAFRVYVCNDCGSITVALRLLRNPADNDMHFRCLRIFACCSTALGQVDVDLRGSSRPLQPCLPCASRRQGALDNSECRDNYCVLVSVSNEEARLTLLPPRSPSY